MILLQNIIAQRNQHMPKQIKNIWMTYYIFAYYRVETLLICNRIFLFDLMGLIYQRRHINKIDFYRTQKLLKVF